MSGANVEDVKKQEQEMTNAEEHVADDEQSVQEQSDEKKNEENNPMPSFAQQEV